MTDYSSIVPDEMLADDDNHRSRTRWLLVIDESGEVSFDQRTYYGGDGTPFDEWHRRTLTYTLAGPGVMAVDRLRADLAEGGYLSVLIDRVKAGHSVEWDGNNNVGTLTEDAEEADSYLRARLEGFTGHAYLSDDLTLWNVGEWMSAGGSNSLATQMELAGLLPESDPGGDAVKEAAKEAIAQARRDGVILTGDVEEYLGDLIREARVA